MPQSLVNQLQQLAFERTVDPDRRQKFNADICEHVLVNSEHITRENFSRLSSADLGLLFQVTDEYYFDGCVGRLCEERADRPLSFRLSTRMTTSGGTTTMFQSGPARARRVVFEIAIATTPLFATFPAQDTDRNSRFSVVGGIRCDNRVQALQRIMEHEMIHLIEMLLCGDSNCSARPFKGMVRRLFGHTASNHQLLTPKDIARHRLGIRPGDTVSFDHQGQTRTGLVNRITKRATVLVRDPQGTRFNDGRHYRTYYVPLGRLRKAS